MKNNGQRKFNKKISRNTLKKLNDRVWINQQYIIKDKTAKQISNMLGDVNTLTVLKYLQALI